MYSSRRIAWTERRMSEIGMAAVVMDAALLRLGFVHAARHIHRGVHKLLSFSLHQAGVACP